MARAAARRRARAGLAVEETQDQTASRPSCRSPPTWDGYLEALPSKLRHEIKRKAQEARGGGRAATDRDRRRQDADPAAGPLRGAAPHERGTEGRVHGAGDGDLLPAPGRGVPAAAGCSGSTFIEVGGELAAGTIGFRFDGTVLLYNSAFDRAWGNLAPGMVLVGRGHPARDRGGCDRLRSAEGRLPVQVPVRRPPASDPTADRDALKPIRPARSRGRRAAPVLRPTTVTAVERPRGRPRSPASRTVPIALDRDRPGLDHASVGRMQGRRGVARDPAPATNTATHDWSPWES